MTPEIDRAFDALRADYGRDALYRVEQMLSRGGQQRHPMQKGTRYVMPGLVSRPWRDVNEFPEIARIAQGLEALHPKIKTEIHEAMQKPGASGPYEHYKGSQTDWQALYLFRKGAQVQSSFELVPETARFMKDVIGEMLCPLLEMHFSVLEPGARIAPHCDLWNLSLNLHLAVEIPPGCGIRVGGETREWVEGRCLLFDYSYEHDAWNNSDQRRICLLMDIWNPELTMAERKAVTVLIREIRKLMGEE